MGYVFFSKTSACYWLARGSYQAISVTQVGATLTIDKKLSCFFRDNLNLIDFLSDYLRHDMTQSPRFTEREERGLLNVLEMIKIYTKHTPAKIAYDVVGFGLPSSNQMVIITGNDGQRQETTVAEYMSTKWSITLKHPHVPTIQAKVGSGILRMQDVLKKPFKLILISSN
ncbi:unnamed protein product [Didymodactylos carnosus]|uniref:PAZ domain-containing protein n=1 Tax=Didymodactylos carnosus TaxID=1234261 RepID=A0A8S2EJS4_9BILA|nr:unnamed protein product [Didymodactylos carnosus]CAF4003586.1 unnamed protein product [Didymodactylos carnosus]